MILIRLPISYQLVNVININVDINYQNRLLSISMRYQLSEHSLINFNININIAIFAYQYFLINALSSSAESGLAQEKNHPIMSDKYYLMGISSE